MGWNSISTSRPLSSIDPTLYASTDGASRFQKILTSDSSHGCPRPASFDHERREHHERGLEKVYLMQTTEHDGHEVPSTIPTKFITKTYSYSSAINLFNTVVNLTLLITVNFPSASVKTACGKGGSMLQAGTNRGIRHSTSDMLFHILVALRPSASSLSCIRCISSSRPFPSPPPCPTAGCALPAGLP